MGIKERNLFMEIVEIPKKIRSLMLAGRWLVGKDCPLNEELSKQFGWGDTVRLISNLSKKDEGLLATSESTIVQEIYATYRTGQKDDSESLDWIDANKTLIIAVNYDEEAICLDYRFSKVNPRIVASYFEGLQKQKGRWREVAKNEDELLQKLGIEF